MSEPQAPEIWTTAALRLAIEAAGVALWSWNIITDELSLDVAARVLWGVPDGDPQVTFEGLSAHIHPADRDRVKAAFYTTRAVSGRYEIDFRILIGEVVRWISARGQGLEAEVVRDVTFGVFIDVTERKQAEESNELLAGEMNQNQEAAGNPIRFDCDYVPLDEYHRGHGARTHAKAHGAGTCP